MFANISRNLRITPARHFSIGVCYNASNKPSPYEIESQVKNEVPAFIRTLIQKKQEQPFSEVNEDTFFNAVVKSFAPTRDGPPKRISWNLSMLSYDNLKQSFQMGSRNFAISKQCFVPERHEYLGNEIAAAHFIVFRRGSIKFYGCNEWVKMSKSDKNKDYNKKLPTKFNPMVFVECIDASDMELYFEGLENIRKLARLKWLCLKNSKHIDDWCLNKIANEYAHSLEYLDISDCHNITYRGLVSLCKLGQLSTLVVNNISDSYEFQLSCLMLQQVLPNLKLEGIKFIDVSHNICDSKTNSLDSKEENVEQNVMRQGSL